MYGAGRWDYLLGLVGGKPGGASDYGFRTMRDGITFFVFLVTVNIVEIFQSAGRMMQNVLKAILIIPILGMMLI